MQAQTIPFNAPVAIWMKHVLHSDLFYRRFRQISKTIVLRDFALIEIDDVRKALDIKPEHVRMNQNGPDPAAQHYSAVHQGRLEARAGQGCQGNRLAAYGIGMSLNQLTQRMNGKCAPPMNAK